MTMDYTKTSGKASRPLLLINARIVDPAAHRDERGGILVDKGVITAIGPQLGRQTAPEGAEIIDCAGHVLIPGLVDMRVQLREPGEEHQETIATGSLAAAAGGVTSMVCLPNTDPIIDDVSGVEYIARRARARPGAPRSIATVPSPAASTATILSKWVCCRNSARLVSPMP